MRMAKNILILHGPNLNLLGSREPAVYGTQTLHDINQQLQTLAQAAGATCRFAQSNYEGELIEHIHASGQDGTDFILINAGAYTHTSIGIRDALSAVQLPFIEVHLSNVYQRESFRHHSYLSDLAQGVIAGLGAYGYVAALQYALQLSSE